MDIGLILLGLVGLALVLACVHVLTRMARERESAVRRKQSAIHPFSGDTTTYAGHS